MENEYMTNDIKELLEKIEHSEIFERHPLYFIGGTALSVYLDHRISYDVDITSTALLPISDIKAFAFPLKATHIPDSKASVFRINSGKNLDNYYMKFMVDGVKLEFSYFDDELRQSILVNAISTSYSEGSKLKILSLDDIISLKAIALFGRQKSRDLFDMAIILERKLLPIEELERIYSFKQIGEKTLLEYIQGFDVKKDDDGDSSLDFLPHHDHYKTFAKLTQDERFDKCKEMFLDQYNDKQKKKLEMKTREVFSSIKHKKNK
jgi:predicted nucleotidyltransferase component of viral defense system